MKKEVLPKKDVLYLASEWSVGGHGHVQIGQQNTILDILADLSQHLESQMGQQFGTVGRMHAYH